MPDPEHSAGSRASDHGDDRRFAAATWWAGGATDRGQRHRRNEDALAVAALPEPGSFAALVVCDGVSSAPSSDLASQSAASEALGVLTAGAVKPDQPPSANLAERLESWSTRLRQATVAANRAVTELTGTLAGADPDNPPSCTLVAAVVDAAAVVVGWIGDSRAYWVPDTGDACQLTVDDSWAQAAIAAGTPPAIARSAPQAHSITRWIGPDAPAVTARTASMLPTESGWVLICSDGLWNYCPTGADLAQVFRESVTLNGSRSTDIAAGLVRWANAQGGRDNITVALARFEWHEEPDSLFVGADTLTSANP